MYAFLTQNHGVWMGNMLENKVLNKLDEIIDCIKESDTYKRFVLVEEQMNNNKELMSLIEEIKSIQQELVKKEEMDLDTTNLNTKYQALKDELYSYPIYNEYNELLEELDNTYQEIKTVIEKYLNNKLN